MTQATPQNYWISSNALHIELNAIGNRNYVHAACVSGAQILVYVKDIISFDAGHNYRRWTLQASPTAFNTDTAKYVYVAIPRDTDDRSKQNTAVVVFPSEEIDIYGKNEAEEQIGSEDYYYIFLQGIITPSVVEGVQKAREWEQPIVTGYLSSDEALSAAPNDSEWYKYNPADKITTFIKDLTMKAGTKFVQLFAHTIQVVSGGSITFEKGGNIKGVANNVDTDAQSAEKIVTPAYGESAWLSKAHDDTAHGQISFEKRTINLAGAMFGNEFIPGYLGKGGNVDDQGNAELESLTLRSFLSVPELRFNRAYINQGTTMQSPCAGIIKSVKKLSATQGEAELELGDDDIAGSIKRGDFCWGYWHDLSVKSNNATADADDHNGRIEYRGFATVYFHIDAVLNANSTKFAYTLKPGSTLHPYEGMHFGGRGNNEDKDRQGFQIVTPNYTAIYQMVSSWDWEGAAHVVKVSGRLDGFEALVNEQPAKWKNHFGTIDSNVYMRGVITQVENTKRYLYITQSQNGNIIEGRSETITLEVRDTYFADVTESFRFELYKGSQLVDSIDFDAEEKVFTIPFNAEWLDNEVTELRVVAISRDGKFTIEMPCTVRRLISGYVLKTYKGAVNPNDDDFGMLAWDDGSVLMLGDGEAIEVVEPGSTVSAVRRAGTVHSDYGVLYYSIDDKALLDYYEGSAIAVSSENISVEFFWYADESRTELIDRILIPVVYDGKNGKDGKQAWAIYHDGTTAPTAPIEGEDIAVKGWHEGMTASTIWISMKTSPSLLEGKWGTPIRLRGESGTSVTIKGRVSIESALPSNETDGAAYIVEKNNKNELGHLFVFYAGTNRWIDVGQFQGEKGQTAWVHIKYSNDGGLTFTPNNGEDPGSWIGIYTDHNEDDPDTVTPYTWRRISGVSVTKVEEQYALNNSNTAYPVSGWSDNMLTMTPTARFLWKRMRVYLDAEPGAWSTPQVIGMYVEDGVGIANITNYYLAVNDKSDVTPSTYKNWQTKPESVSLQAPYLWSFSRITYTNGSHTDTTPAIICQYAKDGVGISSYKEYYAISDSDSVAPSANAWKENTILKPTAEQPYLWNYNVTTFTSGEDYKTTPLVIGNFSRDGEDTKQIITDRETIKPGEERSDGLLSAWDERFGASTLLAFDDGRAISFGDESRLVRAVRTAGTSISDEGTFKYSINGGDLHDMTNLGSVEVSDDDSFVAFYWYNADGIIIASKTVHIVKDGVTSFTSMVFKRSSTTPSIPEGAGSFTSPVPDGWSDGIPSGDKQVWMSKRIFFSDNRLTPWSTPMPMTDTADIDICYNSSPEKPASPTAHGTELQGNGWHNTANENDIWMAVSRCSNGIWGGWQIFKIKGEKGEQGDPGIQGIPGAQGADGKDGADGKTLYTWVKYADDQDGNGMSDYPSGKKYIGISYNHDTPDESDKRTDYTWALIQGKDGIPGTNGRDGANGANGITYYTWMKYADVQHPVASQMYDTPNDNTKYIGIAVNKTSAVEGTDPSEYTWAKYKGEDGADGESVPYIVTDRDTIKIGDNRDGNLLAEWEAQYGQVALAFDDGTVIAFSDESRVVRAVRKRGEEVVNDGSFYYCIDGGPKSPMVNNGSIEVSDSNHSVTFYWYDADDILIASKHIAVVVDGLSPHVGTNGNWFFGNNDTGVKATPEDPDVWSIHDDGYWYLNGNKTQYTAVGKDGQSVFVSYVFRRSDTTVTVAPVGGSFASPHPTTSGWSDGIPSGVGSVWMSQRCFTSDGQAPQQTAWTTPCLMTDTADIDVAYSASPNRPTAYPEHVGTNVEDQGNGWHNTATDNDIWMAVSTKVAGTWTDWQITKVKGEAGPAGTSPIVLTPSTNIIVFPTEVNDNGNTVIAEGAIARTVTLQMSSGVHDVNIDSIVLTPSSFNANTNGVSVSKTTNSVTITPVSGKPWPNDLNLVISAKGNAFGEDVTREVTINITGSQHGQTVTGKPGASITNVVEWYCRTDKNSDRNTAPAHVANAQYPGTGWQQSHIEPEPNYPYVWNVEVVEITDGDGNRTYQSTDVHLCCELTNSIDHQTNRYFVNNEDKAPTDTEFDSSAGFATAEAAAATMSNTKRYLWNRERTYFTNGEYETQYRLVCRQGEQGQRGNSHVRTQPYYCASTSDVDAPDAPVLDANGNPDRTSYGWHTSLSGTDWSPTKPHLWRTEVEEVISYDNNTVSHIFTVHPVTYFSKWSAEGRGIAGMTETFRANNSMTNRPVLSQYVSYDEAVSNWGEKGNKYKYLWKCTTVKYSDGSPDEHFYSIAQTYEPGPEGPAGPVGPVGPAGPEGPSGTNGKDGVNGKFREVLYRTTRYDEREPDTPPIYAENEIGTDYWYREVQPMSESSVTVPYNIMSTDSTDIQISGDGTSTQKNATTGSEESIYKDGRYCRLLSTTESYGFVKDTITIKTQTALERVVIGLCCNTEETWDMAMIGQPDVSYTKEFFGKVNGKEWKDFYGEKMPRTYTSGNKSTWQQFSVLLKDAGTHTIDIMYRKDATGNDGDKVWWVLISRHRTYAEKVYRSFADAVWSPSLEKWTYPAGFSTPEIYIDNGRANAQINYLGEWSATTEYMYNADRRDIVRHDGKYYMVCDSATNVPVNTPPPNASYWEVANNFKFVATEVLLAEKSYIQNLQVNDVNVIKSNNTPVCKINPEVGVQLYDTSFAIVNNEGVPLIKAGVDDDGLPMLSFYDSGGRFIYNLGIGGIGAIGFVVQKWVNVKMLQVTKQSTLYHVLGALSGDYSTLYRFYNAYTKNGSSAIVWYYAYDNQNNKKTLTNLFAGKPYAYGRVFSSNNYQNPYAIDDARGVGVGANKGIEGYYIDEEQIRVMQPSSTAVGVYQFAIVKYSNGKEETTYYCYYKQVNGMYVECNSDGSLVGANSVFKQLT